MATFTPQDVIDEVRGAIQDATPTYRYDDATMLRGVNHCLKRIALLRPDLFAHVASFTCALGTIQTMPADSVRIIDVLQNAAGANVNEVNRATLDLAYASWQAGATGPTEDWMRHVRNPNVFFVFPPSPAAQVLTIEYVQAPKSYTINETITLIADAYFPVLVDCVVWWFESFDNESVSNQRAQMFLQSWNQMLNITVQAKPVTDTESGGEDRKTVI